jgi:CheY-like chemotaxis protein
MGRTRILLADDPTIGCAGLAKLLEPQYEITGMAEDGRALLKAVGKVKPALVLLGHRRALVKWQFASR